MFVKLAVAASLVASVAAHATFQELWVNGVDQGTSCARLPASNSPVTSVTTPVCLLPLTLVVSDEKHADGRAGYCVQCQCGEQQGRLSSLACVSFASAVVFHRSLCVAAGDEVTVEMHQQPGDRSCANEAIGGAHYGPINVRLPSAMSLYNEAC